MLTAAGLAWGFASGVPVVVLALVGLAVYKPWFALLVIVAVTAFGRSKPEAYEGAFLQAVASELRAGASLRAAVAEAAVRIPSLASIARAARAGRPLEELAGSLALGLDRHGALTAAAVRIAGTTGGRVADTFDELALLAAEDMVMEGERRAATAQARISAWIVGGLPVAYLAYAASSGRLSALWNAGTVGVVVLGLGSFLLLSGVSSIVVMVRRASR